MPRKKLINNNFSGLFWVDVTIAAAQVTFGVIAAIWFIPPIDIAKIAILGINAMLTLIFLFFGSKINKRYDTN